MTQAEKDKKIKQWFLNWEAGAMNRYDVTMQLRGIGLSYNDGMNRYNELVCRHCGYDKVPNEPCKNPKCGEEDDW